MSPKSWVVWGRQKGPGNTSVIWVRILKGRWFSISLFLPPCDLHLMCSCLTTSWWMQWPCLPLLLPPVCAYHLGSRVASTWLLCCWPQCLQVSSCPEGMGPRCLLQGDGEGHCRKLNNCDRLLSYLTSFLSQTLIPSVYFCCRFIRHRVKCPFSSANCHHVCFMNKIIH